MRITDSLCIAVKGVLLCICSVAVLRADCNTLVYGGANGNPNDIGANDSWYSDTYRLDGNHVVSYSQTTITGVNAGLVRPQVITYLYLGSTLMYTNNITNTTYGGTYTQTDTSQLFLNNNYYLGTYQLGLGSTGNGNYNNHWGDSPICTGQGYPYSALHYYDYGNQYTAFKPTITVTGASGNPTSWGFWYLGGAPSIDGYYTQVGLTGNTNWGTGTRPITWTTIQGASKINTNPTTGPNVTVTALAPSAYGGYNPDIQVQISTDGLPSAPFPLFINTPYTMLTGAGTYGTCTDIGMAEPGYHNSVQHGLADLAGASLVWITTTESLENDHYVVGGMYNASNSNWAASPSNPSTWCPVGKSGCSLFWDTNTSFSDFTAVCGPSPIPNASSYNPNGTNPVDNLTQKFWVGSAAGFSGECPQEDVLTYYTDHGSVSGIVTPVTNQSQCASGNVIN